jgi:hypothetical protein
MQAVQPNWITLFAVACGLVAVVVLVIVVILGVLMTRRKPTHADVRAASADELSDLRVENERLRAENERLRKALENASSTDIQET